MDAENNLIVLLRSCANTIKTYCETQKRCNGEEVCIFYDEVVDACMLKGSSPEAWRMEKTDAGEYDEYDGW